MAARKTNKQLGREIESVSLWDRKRERESKQIYVHKYMPCVWFEGHEKDGWWRNSRGLRVIKWYCVDAIRALRWKGRISWTVKRSEESSKTGTNITHSHNIQATWLSTAIKLMNWVEMNKLSTFSAGSIKSRLIWSLILSSLVQCSHGMCAKRRPSHFRRIGSYFSHHHLQKQTGMNGGNGETDRESLSGKMKRLEHILPSYWNKQCKHQVIYTVQMEQQQNKANMLPSNE